MWMFLSTVGFSISHLIVRMVSPEIHSAETVFFRGLFGLIVISPWVFRQGVSLFRTDRIKLHLLRALVSFSSVSCFYHALTIIPLAKATAIGFIAPIAASILAVLFLNESARKIHWVALALGLIGALLILRPGLVKIDFGVAIMLASACLFAVNLIVIKLLSKTDSSVTITVYISILMLPISLPWAIPVWVWPSAEQLLLLGIMGMLNGLSLLAFTQAMKDADTAVVMPLDFLRLVWMALFGFLLYNESPDAFTLFGGALIFSGAILVGMVESLRRPLART